MGHQNREIERKYEVIPAQSIIEVKRKLKRVLESKVKKIIVGDSTDIYFRVPKTMRANFARVRMMPGGKAQLTIKHTDKLTNEDRIEIDVPVTEPAQAIAFCTQLFGLPEQSVRKKYWVYFLDHNDTNVSVYQVHGDNRVFIEIEANNIDLIERLEKTLRNHFALNLEKRSIYQIFVKGAK